MQAFFKCCTTIITEIKSRGNVSLSQFNCKYKALAKHTHYAEQQQWLVKLDVQLKIWVEHFVKALLPFLGPVVKSPIKLILG